MDDLLRRIREVEPPKPSARLSKLQPEDLTTTAQRRQTQPIRLIQELHGDLDWIVMKCLEKNRACRYETANALTLDLERHLGHQPVTAAAPSWRYRLAKFARRNRAGLGAGTALALLLVGGTAVSLWEAVRANRARALAERHAAEARENLWASYLTTARASRTSGRPGRRFAALEAAGKAAAIRPSFELRSEAASALALPDVRPVCEQANLLPAKVGLAIDRRFGRYAACDLQGDVKVLGVNDGRELLALPKAGWPQCFSPDGRFLATIQATLPTPQARIWNLDTRQLVLEAALCGNTRAMDFHPTAPILGVVGPTAVVECFDLATGRRWSWPTSNHAASCLRFRPDGQQLAVSGPSGRVRVYETDSGTMVTTLRHGQGVRYFDWSPDGRWLAAPCDDGVVYLWDMGQGGRLDARLEGHDHVVTSVGFDPQGEFLVSQAWDGTSALWSLASHSRLFNLPGCDCPLSFSADGRWVGPYVAGRTVRLLEVVRAPGCRLLPAQSGKAVCNGAFSPDGRWVVLGGEGLQCWDTRSAQRVWTEPTGYVRWVGATLLLHWSA